MRRNTALLLSGVVTAFVLVLVIGLAGGVNWLMGTAQAASPGQPSVQSAAVTGTAAQGTGDRGADVQALQQQVDAYKTQLQQAYDALQAAYDQISQIQAQQQQGFTGGGRRHEEGEFNGFFGGGDD